MTPQQAARYQTPTPGNLRAAYSGGPASLAGWLIARLVMTVGTHQSDHTLSEKVEASFEGSDPQRLKIKDVHMGFSSKSITWSALPNNARPCIDPSTPPIAGRN